MAKIIFGSIVTDIRGKLGGQVYSSNRYGAMVRNKVSPTNARTSFQTAVRVSFQEIAQLWRALTPAQQAAWQTATEYFKRTNVFGQVKTLTGSALFQSLSMNLKTVGGVIMETPPSPAPLPSPIPSAVQLTTVDGQVSDFSVNFSEVLSPGYRAIIEATPPLSAGIYSAGTRFKLCTVSTPGTPPSAAVDFTADYQTRFGGTAQPGQVIFVRTSIVNFFTGEPTQKAVTRVVLP